MITRKTPLIAITVGVLAVVPAAASARHGHSGRDQHHQRGHHQRGRGQDVSGTIESFSNGILSIRQSDGTLASGKVTSDTAIRCGHDGRARAASDGQSSASDAGDRRDGQAEPTAEAPENEPAEHDNGDTTATSAPAAGVRENEASGNEAGENEATENPAEDRPASENAAPCDSSSLKSGVTVDRARLRGTGDSATFKKVELS